MPNITGSITAQKKRYNNDFYLLRGSQNLPIVVADTTLSEINNNSDWSISFSFIIENSGTFRYIAHCRGTEGWAIRVTPSTTFLNIYFQTNNSAQTRYLYTVNNAKFDTLNSYVFVFDSTTKNLSLFCDSNLIDTQTITTPPFQNNGVAIANSVDGKLDLFRPSYTTNSDLEGGIKDFATFNKQLTQREINHIYEVGVLPSSTHEAVQFHLPLNNVVLVDGTDRLMLDVIENYNYAKTVNLTPNHGVATGWTDDELGLNTGTSTFTAYADFYTKVAGQNFSGGGDAITYKGEELRYYGLQFDSSSGHNLTIQGLNTAKTNGYTFLVAVANKNNAAWTSGQANIFSHIGTEGSSRQFEIEGSASNTGKALRIVFPSGSSTAGLDSYADNDFDNSKIQFASFALSPNQDYYLTYLRSSQTRGYGQASFNTNVNQSNSVNTSFPLSFGFNEITTPTTKIGYNGTDSLDGILCYFAIVEGLEDQAIIKRQFNNGLLSNPSDFERLGLNLAFFADLNNPFDDAGTIKIPDLGDNNLTVIADSDLDSTWSTLAGVQSSQVELKTLL